VISGAISAGPSKSRTAFGAKQDAVVLAAAPKILLANEPTSEVDVGQGPRFWNSLKSTAGMTAQLLWSATVRRLHRSARRRKGNRRGMKSFCPPDDVTRYYANGPLHPTALRNITCQVIASARVAIVGPSGGGAVWSARLLVRRLRAKFEKIIVDVQAANPSS